VVVADGAGGTSGGAEAAQAVVDHLRLAVDSGRELNARGLRQLLLESSLELENRGQTTAVVLVIDRHQIVGASVGDSGAWLVEEREWKELTLGQPRKPLLGGGFAEPFTFVAKTIDAELLVATDGVLKYANGDSVRALLRNRLLSAESCCHAVIDAARLSNGALQDDAAAVVVRLRPEARLVTGLRQWVNEGGPAPGELLWQLERFLLSAFPSPLAAGTDGASATLEEHHDGTVLIRGTIWRIDTMHEYPFRARLDLGRDRLEDYELQLGEGDEQVTAIKVRIDLDPIADELAGLEWAPMGDERVLCDWVMERTGVDREAALLACNHLRRRREQLRTASPR
jgi:serine/threonine protein phosphatase PrpC